MNLLEEIAPQHYAEDFDNTGLLVGDPHQEVSGVLVAHDTLGTVVDEAIAAHCNLIVSFHPILFSGLKSITGKTYVERAVQKAIKHDISIFAVHTALDNSWNGVNAAMCEKLGLQKQRVLIPKMGTVKKLTVCVPTKNLTVLQNALFAVGAGAIGNYSDCGFSVLGTTSFKPKKAAGPTVGATGKTHLGEETQLQLSFAAHLEGSVLKTLGENHPYEEIAYGITTLENKNQHIGMGMYGHLPVPMQQKDFLQKLKSVFKTGCVRHSTLLNKKIGRVAVLGGSGSFAIGAAQKAGCDAFVTADLKYHDFYRAENNILLADVGHYESERYTKELLVAFLTKKIANFAPAFPEGKVVLSKTNTNPVSYF